MRLTFSLVVVVPLLIAGSLGIEDFDTIEIIANYEPPPRDKRGAPEPDIALNPDPSAESRATISISCKTARDEDGVCKLFKECYPLFQLRDLELKQRRKRQIIPAVEIVFKGGSSSSSSYELERIYRNDVSGPCDKDILNAIASINIGKGGSMDEKEYVCCPKEKTKPPSQPSRPPAPPTPRPEVVGGGGEGGGSNVVKCGKTFKDDLEAEEGNVTTDATTTDPPESDDGGEGAVPRIVNGRPASKGEFPWAVALLNNGVQFCGGSLISDSHVLTAAHCIYYMNQNDVSKLSLSIGDHNVYSEADGVHEERTASNIYYHRGFSMSTLYDDISVIRMSKPVKFGRYIQPVCLHSGSPPYDTGTVNADVIGWGQIANKGPPSKILNTVSVRVITNKECIKSYGKKAPAGISKDMICAGGNGRDSCRGDSGGPLTIDSQSSAKQIGVVSWGIGCATYPGVYTRVDKYQNWIYKNQR